MEKSHRRKAAVALKYAPEEGDEAPRILARGKGKLADSILAAAREHGVPITEDPVLVEELYEVEVNCTIPPELYEAVAEVLAYVYRRYKSFRV